MRRKIEHGVWTVVLLCCELAVTILAFWGMRQKGRQSLLRLIA